jgi:hypothetical protein
MTDKSNNLQAKADESWAAGFISGVAWTGVAGDPFATTDYNSAMQWIDNYCRSHPTDAVPAAIA